MPKLLKYLMIGSMLAATGCTHGKPKIFLFPENETRWQQAETRLDEAKEKVAQAEDEIEEGRERRDEADQQIAAGRKQRKKAEAAASKAREELRTIRMLEEAEHLRRKAEKASRAASGSGSGILP